LRRRFGAAFEKFVDVVHVGAPSAFNDCCREFTGANEAVKKIFRYLAIITD
jgi:hypothetical protein